MLNLNGHTLSYFSIKKELLSKINLRKMLWQGLAFTEDVLERIRAGHGEHMLEGEAETQPTNEDARPRRQVGAGKFRHLLLGGRGGGAHQLQAGDLEEMVAVVLVEGERGAVGRFASR